MNEGQPVARITLVIQIHFDASETNSQIILQDGGCCSIDVKSPARDVKSPARDFL